MAEDTGNPAGEPMTTQEFLNDAMQKRGAAQVQDQEPQEAQEDDAVEEAEGETSEAAEESTEPEGTETEQEDEGPQVLTVEEYGDIVVNANGEETSLKDLVAGSLRQADYSRKMNELSKAGKEREAEFKQKEAELAAREQRLAEELAEVEGTEPDWVKLADEDPLGWASEKAKWDAKQNLKAKRLAENKKRQDASLKQFIAETAAKAVEAVPEWSDVKKFDEGAQVRRDTALAAGFTAEEYDSTPDFRIATLLHWAAQGRAAAESSGKRQAAAAKKIAKAPKVLKPGQSLGDRNPTDEKRVARQKRLTKPISTQDYLKAAGIRR